MSSRRNSLSTDVRAPLWVVLHAIRYGQPRLSYAAYEACDLAEQYWDDFPRHIQEQIIADWRHCHYSTALADPQLAARWDRLAARLKQDTP